MRKTIGVWLYPKYILIRTLHRYDIGVEVYSALLFRTTIPGVYLRLKIEKRVFRPGVYSRPASIQSFTVYLCHRWTNWLHISCIPQLDVFISF